MRTVEKVETRIDDLKIGWWDESKNLFILYEDMDEDELRAFFSREDFKTLLLDSLVMYKNELVERIGDDLKDIWERLDKIESK